MLDGMTRLLPMADVGFVGLRRDEESLVASTYADRLPADLTDRDTFVLDPMLATGGTLATVISMLASRGAASVTAICLLAAPEGLRHWRRSSPRRRAVGAGGDRGGRRAAERARVHRARDWVTRRSPVRPDLAVWSFGLGSVSGRAPGLPRDRPTAQAGTRAGPPQYSRRLAPHARARHPANESAKQDDPRNGIPGSGDR